MQRRANLGNEDFCKQEPVIIRAHNQVVTSSYVLCADHNSEVVPIARNGNIDVVKATFMTLWFLPRFVDATSFEIQVRHVFGTRGKANLTLTDLASVNGSAVVTSSTGGFVQEHVGKYLFLTAAGTNGLVGVYKVVGFTSPASITVDRDIADAGNMSGATGTIFTESVEQVVDTPAAAGVSDIYAHEIKLTAANHATVGWKHVTLPIPGAMFARVYVKGTGTLDDTDLVVAYSLECEGGV